MKTQTHNRHEKSFKPERFCQISLEIPKRDQTQRKSLTRFEDTFRVECASNEKNRQIPQKTAIYHYFGRVNVSFFSKMKYFSFNCECESATAGVKTLRCALLWVWKCCCECGSAAVVLCVWKRCCSAVTVKALRWVWKLLCVLKCCCCTCKRAAVSVKALLWLWKRCCVKARAAVSVEVSHSAAFLTASASALTATLLTAALSHSQQHFHSHISAFTLTARAFTHSISKSHPTSSKHTQMSVANGL